MSEMRLFCTFQLAGRRYGVDILEVKEVNIESTFTRIPHAPPAVRGYVNLRGQIYLVLDLRRLMGLPPACITAESRLMIFKSSVGPNVGVLVDCIGDIVRIPTSQIEPWKAGRTLDGEHSLTSEDLIASVGKCAEELVIILDARRFLRAVEQAMQR